MRVLSPGQNGQNLPIINGEKLTNRLAGHGINTIGASIRRGNKMCSFCQAQAFRAPIVSLQNRMTED